MVLILGTPVTALMAHEHGGIPPDMKACFVGMLGAAFLPPAPRVAGFTAGIAAMVALHFRRIMNANLAVQLALYAAGGAAFLRYDLKQGFQNPQYAGRAALCWKCFPGLARCPSRCATLRVGCCSDGKILQAKNMQR